jgi:hypothetical protein
VSTPESQELAARLAFLAGEHRTLLVATARTGVDTRELAGKVAAALNVVEDGATAGEGSQSFRILAGRGLLDDPETVVQARMANAVVLVVRRGTTRRSDLAECRSVLDVAGVPLLAAVLVD